jgi:hypothetical protein
VSARRLFSVAAIAAGLIALFLFGLWLGSSARPVASARLETGTGSESSAASTAGRSLRADQASDSTAAVTTETVDQRSAVPAEVSAPQGELPSELWREHPVAPNLARWSARAGASPELAAELASVLRDCAGVAETSEAEVRADLDALLEQRRQAGASESELHEIRTVGGWGGRRYLFQLDALRRCQGVENPVTQYLRWLERAARELPHGERRAALRIEFAEHVFDDLKSRERMIGAIDEVIRRRDIARAWLAEGIEAGSERAIRAYVDQLYGQGALYAKDLVEAQVWNQILQLRIAVRVAESARQSGGWRPSQSPAQVWERGIDFSGTGDWVRVDQHAELNQRFRDTYLRLFGAPPG